MGTHLTDAIIRRLPIPAKGYKITFDDEVPGFGIRITASGVRSFVYNYRVKTTGREKRPTVGRFPSWSTTTARQEARRLEQLVDRGFDPQGDVVAERAAATVGDLADRFVAEHLPRKRPGTARHYTTLLDKYVRPAWKSRKVSDITFDDVDALHRRVSRDSGPYAANRLHSVVSKMFTFAARWGMRPDNTNPAKGVERNLESRRRRYLTGDELARLVKALANCPSRQVADIVRVALFSGCRIGEALSMRWADIDLVAGTWDKPAEATKQKAAHSQPLAAPLRQLLAEIRTAQTAGQQFVFPSTKNTGSHCTDINHAWRRLRRDAGIEDVRLHDLRHSFASQLASGGASLWLIAELLGHSSPTMAARYSHLYDSVARSAVEKVGVAIANAGNDDADETVVPLLPLKGGRHGHR